SGSRPTQRSELFRSALWRNFCVNVASVVVMSPSGGSAHRPSDVQRGEVDTGSLESVDGGLELRRLACSATKQRPPLPVLLRIEARLAQHSQRPASYRLCRVDHADLGRKHLSEHRAQEAVVRTAECEGIEACRERLRQGGAQHPLHTVALHLATLHEV